MRVATLAALQRISLYSLSETLSSSLSKFARDFTIIPHLFSFTYSAVAAFSQTMTGSPIDRYSQNLLDVLYCKYIPSPDVSFSISISVPSQTNPY